MALGFWANGPRARPDGVSWRVETIPKVSEERATGKGPGPGPMRQGEHSWDRSQGSSAGG